MCFINFDYHTALSVQAHAGTATSQGFYGPPAGPFWMALGFRGTASMLSQVLKVKSVFATARTWRTRLRRPVSVAGTEAWLLATEN
jgi:hypothetical protein